jgi:hypothetical protein
MHFGAGRIAVRQTTFMELALDDGSGFRLDFEDKREFLWRGADVRHFERGEVLVEHPLLVDYSDPLVWLEFYGRPANPTAIVSGAREVVAARSKGWRTADRYFNPYVPPERLLEFERGIFWGGPALYSHPVADLLEKAGTTVRRRSREGLPGGFKVAVFGRSYVIARNFRIARRAAVAAP